MIDLHCHILPGLDDGARDLAASLAMARMAVADGIRMAVATPHLLAGRYDHDLEKIRSSMAVVQNALVEAAIPLELGCAAEVRLTPCLHGRFRAGRIPLLHGGSGRQYYLLEFPHAGIEPGTLYEVELLCLQGFWPVIAHPERIRTIQVSVAAMEPYVRLGALGQLTASSLCGGFGLSAQVTAEALLARGWIQVIASDGHGFHSRQMVMADGVRVAAELIGVEAATAMVTTNPQAILRGENLGHAEGMKNE